MQRRFLLSVTCALLTCGASIGAEPKDADKKSDKPDAERIIGTWTLESTSHKIDVFQGDGQSVQLKFEGERFEFAVLKDGGKVIDIPGSYFLDDKQTPKLFDVTLTGDGGTTAVYAIYDFQGDKLRIRIRDNNGPRPADFDSPADDCNTLTFVRDPSAG